MTVPTSNEEARCLERWREHGLVHECWNVDGHEGKHVCKDFDCGSALLAARRLRVSGDNTELSDTQLFEAYRDAHVLIRMQGHGAGDYQQHTHAAGLRAVEAAVRADMQPREVRTVAETPIEHVAHFWSEWIDEMAPLHERGVYRVAAEDFAKKFIVTERTPSAPNQQGAEQS
jgi:hypothetical protein